MPKIAGSQACYTFSKETSWSSSEPVENVQWILCFCSVWILQKILKSPDCIFKLKLILLWLCGPTNNEDTPTSQAPNS